MPKTVLGLIFLALTWIALAPPARAQEAHQELQGTWRARVLEVVSEEERPRPGLGIVTTVQVLRAEILEGERRGEAVTFENDYMRLQSGDRFFLNYLVTVRGDELYSVMEPDRRFFLAGIIGLFAAAVIAFGGWQGLRALAALGAGILILVYFLLPQLAAGAPPVITSILVAIAILTLAMVLTHGVNLTTLAALLGTAGGIAFTGLFGAWAVGAARLSGFVGEEVIYLNFRTGGSLDLSGLLLAAIIIGMLGVLDDVAITQAAAVSELAREGAKPRQVYLQALRIGRAHVGAVVNTLALAYAGAALPLLLLLTFSEMPVHMFANREFFAAEIVRTVAGSLGLVLTVPLTTAVAVWLLISRKRAPRES